MVYIGVVKSSTSSILHYTEIMKRIIMHADINHCYAQIEEMLDPSLRQVPMVVGGHEEKRHGIVLAKNDLCRGSGVFTAQSLMEARNACADLRIVLPHYDTYIDVTNKVKSIYARYSDRVESFGMDEAWVDLSGTTRMYPDTLKLVKTIQKQVMDECGLTISIGLSFNKIFAKLGSDQYKRQGLMVITKDNYKDIVWPLPASELLYVGYATAPKLATMGIHTIGQLACANRDLLVKRLGKMGGIIQDFANGIDHQEVALLDTPPLTPKSVGNGLTTINDMTTLEEARLMINVLSDSVASRMKASGVVGNTISLFFRDNALMWYQMQKKLDFYTDSSETIANAATQLLSERYDFIKPLRQITVSMKSYDKTMIIQKLSLDNHKALYKDQQSHDIDVVMDQIRDRYGFTSIGKTSDLLNKPFTDEHIKDQHVVYPRGYFHGG